MLLPHVQPPARDTYHQRVTDRGPERVLIADVLKLRFLRIVVTSASVGAETILQLINSNPVSLIPPPLNVGSAAVSHTVGCCGTHGARIDVFHALFFFGLKEELYVIFHIFTNLLPIQKIISWNAQEVKAAAPILLS